MEKSFLLLESYKMNNKKLTPAPLSAYTLSKHAKEIIEALRIRRILKVIYLKMRSIFLPLRLRYARRIAIGVGSAHRRGWLNTDKKELNLLNRNDFSKYWPNNSIHAFLAEHVWEHLTLEEASLANRHCLEFLKPGGYLRIAVPDGYNPNQAYLDYVKPGGNGSGADSHKVLYNYKLLKEELEKAGYITKLLEYWDENGRFHINNWSNKKGFIERSLENDPRNKNGKTNYTSLIVDAIKSYKEQG